MKQVIIDVRERDEFDNEQIGNSINIPLSAFGSMAPGLISNLSGKKIILMCISGKRSGLAEMQIKQLGLHEGNEFEVPGVCELAGNWWKGKADILNHDEKLIIDLKTTADLNKFRWSASKYNYDSQAYIYQQLFGYEMLFIAIDKTTHQIGIFDCSPEFLQREGDKVNKEVLSFLFNSSQLNKYRSSSPCFIFWTQPPTIVLVSFMSF